MIYLACYDISSDRTRTKVAGKLLEYGLERIQFSVFIGNIKPRLLIELKNKVQPLIDGTKNPQDSLLFIPLSPQHLERHLAIGDQQLDVDYISGNRLVLII